MYLALLCFLLYHVPSRNDAFLAYYIKTLPLLLTFALAMCKKTHLSCSCLGKSINMFINEERKPKKLVNSQYHVYGVAKFSRVKQEISVLPNQRFKMLNQRLFAS